MRLLAVCVSACLAGGSIANAGLLVSRTDKGFSFTEAYDLTFNGKDKALSLGARPALVDKPPTVSINGTVLKDTDAGVLLQFGDGGPEYLIPKINLKNEGGAAKDIW